MSNMNNNLWYLVIFLQSKLISFESYVSNVILVETASASIATGAIENAAQNTVAVIAFLSLIVVLSTQKQSSPSSDQYRPKAAKKQNAKA